MQSGTYTAEDAIPRIQDEGFREVLKRCLQYLKDHLERVEIVGGTRTVSYYTCGHERRDPNWKPFKNLEAFCKKEKIYRPAFLDVIEDAIGRTFDCECEMLNDRKEVARRRLAAAFGMDFGEEGKRDMDVV